MDHNNAFCDGKLVFTIIDKHAAKEVISKMKDIGVRGFTECLARGTASHKILKTLGLDEVGKVIILTALPNGTANKVMDDIYHSFDMKNPSKGIIFSIDMLKIMGGIHPDGKVQKSEEIDMDSEYELILTIVNRGFAEEVVDASKEAGATGGTIINGRGLGIHENFSFFGVKIEPEKEIVMSLVKKDITKAVMDSIEKKVELSKPGNGMALVLPVNRALGIVSRTA